MNHWLLLESQLEDSGDAQNFINPITHEGTKVSLYMKDYMFVIFLEICIF